MDKIMLYTLTCVAL